MIIIITIFSVMWASHSSLLQPQDEQWKAVIAKMTLTFRITLTEILGFLTTSHLRSGFVIFSISYVVS